MSSFHFVFFSISSFYLYSFHLQLLSCYFSQDFQLCIEDDLRNWSCYWLYWQCFEFFPHSVQCGLQVCYMWPLLWWFQFFYSCFVQNFYEERMLHFITTLFCVYWDHMIYVSNAYYLHFLIYVCWNTPEFLE